MFSVTRFVHVFIQFDVYVPLFTVIITAAMIDIIIDLHAANDILVLMKL